MNRNRPGWMDLNADEEPGDVVLPVEVRVKQGMALLDENHGPEWVHKIDVDTLRLSHPCSCVVGQVYRKDADDYTAYSRGADDLFGPATTPAEFDHGFVSGWATTYDELTTAWRLAILARRAGQVAS